MHRRELRELANHIVRRVKQNSRIRFAQHRRVVVRIARRNHPVIQALERQHRLTLGIFLTQLIAGHPPGFVSDQAMAKQSREAQLAHQRLRELIKSVRENHHLETLAQPIDELHRAVQRFQRGDHFLNVRQLQAVLIEDAQALLHQYVVIGNVPGGGLEGVDPGFFGEGDPDFRYQYPFKIQASNFHRTLPFVVIIGSSEAEL